MLMLQSPKRIDPALLGRDCSYAPCFYTNLLLHRVFLTQVFLTRVLTMQTFGEGSDGHCA